MCRMVGGDGVLHGIIDRGGLGCAAGIGISGILRRGGISGGQRLAVSGG